MDDIQIIVNIVLLSNTHVIIIVARYAGIGHITLHDNICTIARHTYTTTRCAARCMLGVRTARVYYFSINNISITTYHIYFCCNMIYIYNILYINIYNCMYLQYKLLIYIYIYIYIYLYVCVCMYVCICCILACRYITMRDAGVCAN